MGEDVIEQASRLRGGGDRAPTGPALEQPPAGDQRNHQQSADGDCAGTHPRIDIQHQLALTFDSIENLSGNFRASASSTRSWTSPAVPRPSTPVMAPHSGCASCQSRSVKLVNALSTRL